MYDPRRPYRYTVYRYLLEEDDDGGWITQLSRIDHTTHAVQALNSYSRYHAGNVRVYAECLDHPHERRWLTHEELTQLREYIEQAHQTTDSELKRHERKHPPPTDR